MTVAEAVCANTFRRNIVLAGFMGTGKTTVGRLVAQRLGYLFIDLDWTIVLWTGLSIPELFRQQGE
ncbi:MAG: AAA family ATPase [Chloroflexi bacterium]|nr:AAA family ATPase [Chloroflexota bacterium]